MKVLVVAKKTNLELHGETIRKRVKAGQINPRYLARVEKTHKEHYNTLDLLFSLLDEYSIPYTTIGRGLYWPDLSDVSAVFTVGGDGTILEASHHIENKDVILFGVRSASTSVGRLCHCSYEHLREKLESFYEQKLEPVKVARLQARIQFTATRGSSLTEPVLNDFLYANQSPAATTRYKIYIGDKEEEHKSSGVWVSTASGSTGAVLAAGGKEMDLRSRLFQYMVRELYFFSSTYTPQVHQGIFDPDKVLLKIENFSERAILALDGHHGAVSLSFGDSVEFIRGSDLYLAPPSFLQQHRTPL